MWRKLGLFLSPEPLPSLVTAVLCSVSNAFSEVWCGSLPRQSLVSLRTILGPKDCFGEWQVTQIELKSNMIFFLIRPLAKKGFFSLWNHRRMYYSLLCSSYLCYRNKGSCSQKELGQHPHMSPAKR